MSKKLVAFFSASGVTKRAAETLASAIGAELYEIKPVVPYSDADLNWQNPKSRSSVEMKTPGLKSRPEIVRDNPKIGDYDVVFVGFPIWWYTAPTIIHTFLETYDFSGKTIVPFATSGGSQMGGISATLQKVVPNATIKEGRLLNGSSSTQELKAWADSF
ncbi:MAG: NAD(P)H-dependent oxidoreductase [Thermoguttaceae bacterium]|nr:NAD(P)H-dependent oxidoreductase [Thermoguttaceae bacterium]